MAESSYEPQARYSDGQYLDANPLWHDADASWKAKQVSALLEANRVHPTRVCDIGCGSAGVLADLARRSPGAELTGYELSPQAVAVARSEHPEIEVYEAGVSEAIARGPYDVALLMDVFEHVEDYLGFLRSLHGVAHAFVIHIPLDMSVSAVLRRGPILRARSDLGHLHYFSSDTALATLVDAGFNVIDHRFTAGALELPGRGVKSRLAAAPRKLVRRLSPAAAARLLGGFSLLVLAHSAPGAGSSLSPGEHSAS